MLWGWDAEKGGSFCTGSAGVRHHISPVLYSDWLLGADSSHCIFKTASVAFFSNVFLQCAARFYSVVVDKLHHTTVLLFYLFTYFFNVKPALRT